MTDALDEVRDRFASAEEIPPVEREAPPPPPPPVAESDPPIWPEGCPVRPLGRSGDIFYFLNAGGQVVNYGASALSKDANLIALFSHKDVEPLDWLKELGPPRRKMRAKESFNPLDVATKLIRVSSDLPLFDPSTQIRKIGTWRGDSSEPLAHIGSKILFSNGASEPAGQTIGEAIYPATHGSNPPSKLGADICDLENLALNLTEGWNWARPTDVYAYLGWIGQACLGAYPLWRTHLWISGRRGSGKSTLVRIADMMLGGMSSGVKKGSTEAAVRSRTNQMAVARLFDEAETDGEDGKVEKIIELFRLMSDSDGATVERGTSDHAGIQFRLYGAGMMASIIPGLMTAADRSRWAMIEINKRIASPDPQKAAKTLAWIEGEAKRLGPMIWRRMLDQAPERWDNNFQFYAALVQQLGGDDRDGNTIGAILTGWDLLLHDGAPDAARIERAQWIAQPLIDDAKAAEEEGDGERCWRTILAFMVPKDTGGTISVSELIMRNMEREPDNSDQTLLGRLGLRISSADPKERQVFVHGPQHPVLDRALANTRWKGGGHRKALSMLDDVEASPHPIRVGGSKVRGLFMPLKYLPRRGK